MSARPACAYCGKPAPKKTRTVFIDRLTDGRRGGGDSPFSRHIYLEQRPRSKAECQRHTNQQVVSLRYHDKEVYAFSEWDGESYTLNYGLFCKASCAERFAVAAHRAGYRIKQEAKL